MRSRVPEEQHLQISGIWDPAARGGDRPSTGNVAASEAKGSTTNRNSSGGSPCGDKGGEQLLGTKNGDPIGEIKNTNNGGQKLNQKTKGVKKQGKTFPSMDIRLMMMTKMNDDVKYDTPSSVENVKQLVGKQMNEDELSTAPPVGSVFV